MVISLASGTKVLYKGSVKLKKIKSYAKYDQRFTDLYIPKNTQQLTIKLKDLGYLKISPLDINEKGLSTYSIYLQSRLLGEKKVNDINHINELAFSDLKFGEQKVKIYNQNLPKPDNIIYVLDGNHAFTSNVTNLALEKLKILRNSVIVAIYHVDSSERSKFYDISSRDGMDYSQYFIHYLLPRVERKLIGRSPHRYIVGASLGASFALYTLNQSPRYFSGAICFSFISYFMPDEYFLDLPLNSRVYLDFGDQGADKDVFKDNKEYVTEQFSVSRPSQLDILFFPFGGHNWDEWRLRSYDAFRWLLEDK